jgi:heptose I phosphotransferase
MRPFRLDQPDVERLRAGFGAPVSIAADPETPRLPDDYEHPRAVQMEQSGGVTRDKRAVERLRQAGLNSLDEVFHYQPAQSLTKPGLKAHRDRCRLDLQNGDGRLHTYYLKRYRSPPFVEQVRRIREAGRDLSTAKREMRAARKLREIGVPTLKVTAFGQEMSGPWEHRSFILTDGIEGRSLERVLMDAREGRSRVPSWNNRREIIIQLASIVRLLHDQRLYHRDLYLCHFLLTRNVDGGIVLRVIDLARMIERPMRSRRWRIKDLAALEYSAWAPMVTRADRLRFLKTYHYNSISRNLLRPEIDAIQTRVRRMARHDQSSSAATEARA